MVTAPVRGAEAEGVDAPEVYRPCVSPAMQALAAAVARIATSDLPVLICGETGVGKSTLARQLHRDSRRAAAPLVVLEAATVTVAAVEALAQTPERTVVIEEVGDLPPVAQDALVRLLADSALAGGPRLICTTSRDLDVLTQRSSLRLDLRYRLDVVRLDVPPLRQRPEDIVCLAEHFLALAARHGRRDVRGLSPDAGVRLLQHDWQGNARELRNCIFESVLSCAAGRLQATDLRLRTSGAAVDAAGEFFGALAHLHAACPTALHTQVQRLLLQWAMQRAGNAGRAAALLGISRGSLRARLRRYGLEPPAAAAAPRR